MDGIVVCEVQQTSDITYRVYDWNRTDKNGKPRELHKEKALDVINLQSNQKVNNYENINENAHMYKSDIFNVDMLNIDGTLNDKSSKESFFAYIVIEGNGNIKTGNFIRNLGKGDTLLIPSNLGEYTIQGNLKLMKVWI